MSNFRFTVDSKKLRDAINRMEKGARRSVTVPYRRAANAVRDYARDTITMQGRTKAYKPLSASRRLQTGRRKAILALRPMIMSRADKQGGYVYFKGPSNKWNDLTHHLGASFGPAKPIKGKVMVARSPEGNRVFAMRKRKGGTIPARTIWPSPSTVRRIISPVIENWIDTVARQYWR